MRILVAVPRVLKLPVLVVAFASLMWTWQSEARVPWTTSRLEGTPEGPKAFVSESVLDRLRFNEGLELAVVPGTNRLIVVERRGKILSFPLQKDVDRADEIVDLLALHPKLDNAFGVVLHPRFRETREIFVCYAMPEGQPDGTRVSRFKLTSLDPLRADPATEEIVITWRSGGHNGGSLQFGPDGCLYISTGDAGPAAPPDLYATGQDLSDLASSILRIDVDHRDGGRAYRVPPDNPWVGSGTAAANSAVQARPELWAYGLRNPWKMSFDRSNGNLWCGDVGWEMWEMVHLIKRGGNYGWSAFESSQPIKPDLLNPLAPVTRPVVAHAHSEAASITGGFVYRGKKFPELERAYIYGDFVTGKVWALWYENDQITRHEEIADTPQAVVTFGEDDAGELYFLHYAGRETSLHRLVRNPQAGMSAPFPRKLSETGLFADAPRRQLAAGVYPFAITSPLWEDGTEASRAIALRDATSVKTEVRVERDKRGNESKVDYTVTWPKHAVLARTITRGRLALDARDRDKPIETQVLHFDGENWNAYAYRWNEAATDAELVPAEGAELPLRVTTDPNALGSGAREYTWRFQSRAECLRCHNSRTPVSLAFNHTQLRGVSRRQVEQLIDEGIVDANFFEQSRLPSERSVGENATARAWQQANCAHCHTAHAGGSVSVFLNQELLTPQMNAVGAVPAQGTYGLADPKVITPGDPANSVLAIRIAKSGNGHMPLIGARDVDVEGLKLIEDWIARMPSEKSVSRSWADATWDEARVTRELETLPGAMRVRRAIDDGRLPVELKTSACKLAWGSTNPTIRDVFERFKPDELRERTLGASIDVEAILRLEGDASRGAKLLSAEGKLASCQACHFFGGHGRHFGPELSRIGAQQTAAQILDNILSPSKSVAPLYRTTVIGLKDGTSQTGFVRGRGVNELILTVPSGASLKIPLGEIAKEQTVLTSLMPEGLLQGITAQDAADLLAYLTALR